MCIKDRIERLRQKMEEHHISVYMIPTADYHQSEYVGEHFKSRAFITGFTGSAGTAVITKEESCLWTDGRYFLQAESQLQGSGIRLQKMGEPGVPTIAEYIESVLRNECAQYSQQDEDVLTYALFPQVATDFFKYRDAQQTKVDAKVADTEDGAYPV